MLLGRWPDAAAFYTKLAGAGPTALVARSELGVIAARRGDAVTARREIDDLAQMNRPYIRGAHTFYRARVAAALGDRERTSTCCAKRSPRDSRSRDDARRLRVRTGARGTHRSTHSSR